MEKTQKQEDIQQKDQEAVSSNRAYTFMIGFVIAVALLIFIISTIVLFIKIVPDTFALIAGTFQSVSREDADEETVETTQSLSVSNSFVSAGEEITFSWTTPNQEGTPSLAFLCEDTDGVVLEYKDDFFECGDTIFFDNQENEASVRILSSAKRYVDMPVILEFEDQNRSITTIDETSVTISNNNPNESGIVLGDEVNVTVSTTTPVTNTNTSDTNTGTTQTVNTTTTQNTTNTPAPAPVRDLSVRMLQAGPVVNGQIIQSGSFDANSTVGIQFEVRNNGNVSTGAWSFQAVLPVTSVNDRVFNSGLQNSLTPGSGIIYTLTFAGLRGGTNQAVITVDPQNLVSESSKANNQTSATFTVSGGSNSNFSGKADFDVELLGIGRLSGSRFIETDNLDTSDEIAVQFRVTNIGGQITNDWRFEVTVDEPRDASDLDYRSGRFNGLRPGESRDITISFDDLSKEGDYEFEIEVDSDRDTSESTRSNNTIDFDIEIDD